MLTSYIKTSSLASLLIGLVLALGCAADDESGSEEIDDKPANATRSQACVDFVDTMCDHAADNCSWVSRDDCEKSAEVRFCSDDATLAQCTESLQTGTCDDLPEACDEVYDDTPAIWYCNEYLETMCTRVAECSLASKSECLTKIKTELAWDCADAAGATSKIDSCITRAAQMPCGSMIYEELRLAPQECDGILAFHVSSDD